MVSHIPKPQHKQYMEEHRNTTYTAHSFQSGLQDQAQEDLHKHHPAPNLQRKVQETLLRVQGRRRKPGTLTS